MLRNAAVRKIGQWGTVEERVETMCCGMHSCSNHLWPSAPVCSGQLNDCNIASITVYIVLH